MKARILILEDDPSVARAMQRYLGVAGYRSVVVSSCAEVLHSVAEFGVAGVGVGAFELGIFDFELPDGNGVAVAQDLMRAGRVKQAVFFTSQGDPQELRRARRLGPVVRKTEGAGALVRRVEQVLRSTDLGSNPASSEGVRAKPAEATVFSNSGLPPETERSAGQVSMGPAE